MSAHKTTKNHLISQLFWQTEIGADEAISAYPSVQDEMTSLKQYMALLKTPAQPDLSQPKISSEPVSVIQQNTGSGASILEENSGVSDTMKRASLESLTTLNELKIALEKFEGCSLKNTDVSGVRMLEARSDKKWGNSAEYQDYKKNVPIFVPKL